jgi:hypothetical protein
VNIRVEKFPIPIGPWPKDKHLVSLSVASWSEAGKIFRWNIFGHMGTR